MGIAWWGMSICRHLTEGGSAGEPEPRGEAEKYSSAVHLVFALC